MLRTRCGTVGKAVSVVFWCSAAIALYMLCVTVWMSIQPAGDFSVQSLRLENLADTVSYGFFRRSIYLHFGHVAFSEAGLANTKAVFLLGSWCGGAAAAFRLGALWNVRAVFREIQREGTPFTPRTSRAVFGTGACILAASLTLRTVLPILYSAVGLSTGFSNPYSLDELLAGSVVVCLGFVFRYGAALQTESDETL
ncbi:hypothetical protein OBV_35970 [Oscillibacter valericigenes Sjm18-20]|nr:hypothetical protein OBV_35970 [Oscillibacter valericigenes Sjm18-20]